MKDRAPILSAFAASGSVIAAMSCCLPFGAFITAGASATVSRYITPLQPYLLGFAAASLAFGFYQMYGRKACTRRSPIAVAMLWISLLAVASLYFFPQAIANIIAGGASGESAASLADLRIDGIRDEFNAAADRVRVIALLSPT